MNYGTPRNLPFNLEPAADSISNFP